jgi:hypothetical protein
MDNFQTFLHIFKYINTFPFIRPMSMKLWSELQNAVTLIAGPSGRAL